MHVLTKPDILETQTKLAITIPLIKIERYYRIHMRAYCDHTHPPARHIKFECRDRPCTIREPQTQVLTAAPKYLSRYHFRIPQKKKWFFILLSKRLKTLHRIKCLPGNIPCMKLRLQNNLNWLRIIKLTRYHLTEFMTKYANIFFFQRESSRRLMPTKLQKRIRACAHHLHRIDTTCRTKRPLHVIRGTAIEKCRTPILFDQTRSRDSKTSRQPFFFAKIKH